MSKHIEYKPNNKYYSRYNQTWINATMRLINFTISSKISTENPKIIDIGCGRGELLKNLSEKHYQCFGVDFDEECVELCKQYGNIICGNATEIDQLFEENYFDLVIMMHALEHTLDPTEVIRNLKFVTKKYLIIAVPNLSSTSTFWHGIRRKEPVFVNRGHRFGWDSSHLKTFLESSCDLNIIKWEPDRVVIPSKVALFFKFFGMLEWLELKVLPRFFPLLSNSLIVLCEKRNVTD